MDEMYRVRMELSTSAPKIYVGNWEAERRKGWFHIRNYYINQADLVIAEIRALKVKYGEDNVAMGHGWDETLGKPNPVNKAYGIYARHSHMMIESMAAELRAELDDNEQLAKWLSRK